MQTLCRVAIARFLTLDGHTFAPGTHEVIPQIAQVLIAKGGVLLPVSEATPFPDWQRLSTQDAGQRWQVARQLVVSRRPADRAATGILAKDLEGGLVVPILVSRDFFVLDPASEFLLCACVQRLHWEQLLVVVKDVHSHDAGQMGRADAEALPDAPEAEVEALLRANADGRGLPFHWAGRRS